MAQIKTAVTALFAGSIQILQPEGHRTGIFKQRVEMVEVNREGIVGDQQADRRYHGGTEKALHQYSQCAYDAIIAEYPGLQGVAVPGSLGENISSPVLDEASVCIGDYFRIGQVLVQVSQPRSPCWKINHRFGIDKLSLFVEQQRIPGWYYRVVETGMIHQGDELELVDRVNENINIDYFLVINKQHRPPLQALEHLIKCSGLNEEWRGRLASRRRYLQSMEQ